MDEGLGRRMMQGLEDGSGSDYLILASVLCPSMHQSLSHV